MADVSHIGGLIAGGVMRNPFDDDFDVVTTTTHKTLRGPRGGMIMCREAFAKSLNASVFPGNQGGPLMHIIAAKAVAFKEALSPAFKEYQRQIVRNARALATGLTAKGFRLVSGGTDNHLMMLDLRQSELTGKLAQETLDRAHITVNKNTVPFETRSPFVTSGVRIGSPAVTTRGMKEPEMAVIADFIFRALQAVGNDAALASVADDVIALCRRFPIGNGAFAS